MCIFVVPNVPDDFPFQCRTRCEIEVRLLCATPRVALIHLADELSSPMARPHRRSSGAPSACWKRRLRIKTRNSLSQTAAFRTFDQLRRRPRPPVRPVEPARPAAALPSFPLPAFRQPQTIETKDCRDSQTTKKRSSPSRRSPRPRRWHHGGRGCGRQPRARGVYVRHARGVGGIPLQHRGD